MAQTFAEKPKTVQEAVDYIFTNWAGSKISRWNIMEAMGLDQYEDEEPEGLAEAVATYKDCDVQAEHLERLSNKTEMDLLNSKPEASVDEEPISGNTITPQLNKTCSELQAPRQIQNSNTITQETQSTPTITNTINQQTKLQNQADKIYEWSHLLTTEQKEENDYNWTQDTTRLRDRLLTTDRNIIAVKGLQGVGKTALKQALTYTLKEKDITVLPWKWLSEPKKDIINQIKREDCDFLTRNDHEYIQELLDTLIFDTEDNLGGYPDYYAAIKKRLGLTDAQLSTIKAYERIDEYPKKDKYRSHIMFQIEKLCSLFEKALGPKKVNKIKDEQYRSRVIEPTKNFFIDLPDYDRNSKKQMSNDLDRIQQFWENNLMDDTHTQRGNLVIFFQEELFYSHFFMGKCNKITLRPFTAQEITEYFYEKFPETTLFEKDAITELASLSRGIMRRFKKYINTSIEEWRSTDQPTNPITTKNIVDWIRLNEIEKDMEAELIALFPKEKGHRVLTVKLLRHLREKGGKVFQSEIVERFFVDGDGVNIRQAAEMKASRILDKLENYQYITRPRDGSTGKKLMCLT